MTGQGQADRMGTWAGTLTDAHLDFIRAVHSKWTTGLSLCQPSRDSAEAAVRRLYATCRQPEPRLMIWMDSPLGCVYAAAVISQLGRLRAGKLWTRLGPWLWTRLEDQLVAGLEEQLMVQLRTKLRDLLGDPDADCLMACEQPGDEFMERLWDQFRDLGEPLRFPIWDEFRVQLWDRLGDLLGGSRRASLWGQIAEHNGDLGVRLGALLSGQLMDQLAGRPRTWVLRSISAWNDAYLLASYECALAITGMPPSPELRALAAVTADLGWWVPMEGAVVMSGRPSRLCRDGNGDLHSSDGMALSYPDGWGIWCWHGRRVPRWVVEQPTVQRIADEANTEVRRCAIESLGWDRFTAEAGLELIGSAPDPGNPGQRLFLYDVPERLWGAPVRLLICTNGSPERDGQRRRYGKPVPVHVENPLEAAAWTARLTPEQYALMQRRT